MKSTIFGLLWMAFVFAFLIRWMLVAFEKTGSPWEVVVLFFVVISVTFWMVAIGRKEE